MNALCFSPVLQASAQFTLVPNPAPTDIDTFMSTIEVLAAGESSVVYGVDDKRVVKEYTITKNKEELIERRAYQRLGSHPNIARSLGITFSGSIILERGQALRTVSQRTNVAQIPLPRKIRWLRNIAEGLRHIHQKGIVHADVGCQNVILVDPGDRAKIIDFDGCSIDGEDANACYEWFSYRRSMPRVSEQTDIFAYGCLVYEIITGRPPYEEFGTSDYRSYLVRQLYQGAQFPAVSHLPLGPLMQGCWHGTFKSMTEVIQAVDLADRSNRKAKAKFRAASIVGALKSSWTRHRWPSRS